MRLDIFLVSKGFFESREKAQIAIKNNLISINEKCINKPSFDVNENNEHNISVKSVETCDELRYVSRGGFKLEGAIHQFNIKLDNLICADFGASTGGFTDCMLQNNARLVYAIDVGTSQLHPSLLKNNKVKNYEKTNLKDISSDFFAETVDFIATDVSFISLEQIIPIIAKVLKNSDKTVCLVKPQFEAGKQNIGKNGIVKDKKVHVQIIEKILNCCLLNGLAPTCIAVSPIKGTKGNTEYLLCAQKQDVATSDITKEKIKQIVL